MNYEKTEWLFKNDITIKLLNADYAPLIISFFYLAFKQQNRNSYPDNELQSLLGDYLFALNTPKERFPRSASEYLNKWTENGFLRRYYESDDEPIFDLSPAAENALKLMEDLNKQEFVGTESRLLHFFTILKELALKTNKNVNERIKDLEDQKRKLEIEISKAGEGIIEIFDDRKIRERYLYAEDTAKRLLADFRQVEQNFRDLDREVREKIIKSNVSKGKLLDDIFSQQDFMWTTDQGKSFKAFWEFLMSQQKQEELESLIQKVMTLPEIQSFKEEITVNRIKNNLIEAGDKVNRTNDSLIEQLRKFVEQKSLSESKRILRSIEEIEAILVEHRNNKDLAELTFDIDDIFRPHFFMGRSLFSPPIKIKFDTSAYEEGMGDYSDSSLFEQFNIDQEQLKRNISEVLKYQNPVTLKEVLSYFEITKGVAEVVAYYHIASKEEKYFINNEVDEELQINAVDNGRSYKMNVPQIIFNR
jgi:hypothetical protein